MDFISIGLCCKYFQKPLDDWWIDKIIKQLVILTFNFYYYNGEYVKIWNSLKFLLSDSYL